MDAVRVDIMSQPPDALVRQISKRLGDWNDLRAPALRADRVFALAATQQEALGGAVAWVYAGWCELDVMWVEEKVRGTGLGRKLLQVIEQDARRRGCVGVHTDTFTFQALPFYQKLGYEIFGQLEDFSDGNTRYYLKKRFDP